MAWSLVSVFISLKSKKINFIHNDIYNRAGFRGGGGPGPQASHQQGASHQTPQFLKLRNSITNPGLHNFCYHLCIVK